MLCLAPLIILIHGTKLQHVLPLGSLVLIQQLLLLLLVIVKGVPLSDSLLGELLVLQVNVLLDIEDVTFGIPLGLLLD